VKTKRDYEASVDEAEPRRCGYSWGEHEEHECDSLAHEACVVSDRLICHICFCGADIFVRGDR
jgi:hypothetical protein